MTAAGDSVSRERILQLLEDRPELSRRRTLIIHRVDWRPSVREPQEVFDGGLTVEMGYRWNAPGVRTIYGSLEPETALAEAEARRRAFGGGALRQRAGPAPLYRAEVTVESALDLTAAADREALGLSAQDLTAPIDPWGGMSATQRIGLAAFEMELAGLLVPSVRAMGGTNAVLFADRLPREAFAAAVRVALGGRMSLPSDCIRYKLHGKLHATSSGT